MRRRLSVLAMFASATMASVTALVAAPPITVGNGTPDSCNEAALQNALTTAEVEGGGIIQFDCGGAPVTILLTANGGGLITRLGTPLPPAALTPPSNTTVDGGGLVTLEGFGTTVVHVPRDR